MRIEEIKNTLICYKFHLFGKIEVINHFLRIANIKNCSNKDKEFFNNFLKELRESLEETLSFIEEKEKGVEKTNDR